MKKVVLILLSVFFCSLHSFGQLSLQYKDLLDSEFQKRVDFLSLKGVAAAIVFPDSSIWSSAVGNYGTNSLSTDLLYEIGSNTKTMVAATILLLEEDGKITLDDTLYHHISPINNVSYGITIRQLLNHTSGLYNYTNHPNFGPYINSNWSKDIPISYVFDNFLDTPVQSPGGTWSYCNTNYLLLGMVIEKVSGKKLEVVFKEKLYAPLRLNNSYLAIKDTYSKTHLGTWLSNGQYLEDPAIAFMTSAWAAGAVISTPEDLAMWAFRLYRGDLLSDESFSKMNTTISLNTTTSYGLGMFKDIYRGKTYLGHGGTTLQNSEMQYSVSSDFSVVTMVLEQNKAAHANNIQNKLIDIMEAEIQKLSVADLELSSFVEVYPNPSYHQVVIENKRSKNLSISVYNAQGVLVQEFTPTRQNVILDKEQIGSGLFIVRIMNNENGAKLNRKLLIY